VRDAPEVIVVGLGSKGRLDVRCTGVPAVGRPCQTVVRRLTNDKANGPVVGWREYVKVDHADLRLNDTQKPDTVPNDWLGRDD
jgi:hypothetical protein